MASWFSVMPRSTSATKLLGGGGGGGSMPSTRLAAVSKSTWSRSSCVRYGWPADAAPSSTRSANAASRAETALAPTSSSCFSSSRTGQCLRGATPVAARIIGGW
eukprot:scaffold73990_cov74-Phaeocystis_antarctica.AAC.2